MPPGDAATMARLMVEADLRGSDTHGVIRVPLYLKRMKAGGVNLSPISASCPRSRRAALIDGDNGVGHLVIRAPPRWRSRRRAATGVAWVGAA